MLIFARKNLIPLTPFLIPLTPFFQKGGTDMLNVKTSLLRKPYLIPLTPFFQKGGTDILAQKQVCKNKFAKTSLQKQTGI